MLSCRNPAVKFSAINSILALIQTLLHFGFVLPERVWSKQWWWWCQWKGGSESCCGRVVVRVAVEVVVVSVELVEKEMDVVVVTVEVEVVEVDEVLAVLLQILVKVDQWSPHVLNIKESSKSLEYMKMWETGV
ncbi:hypothetical protein BJ741DRAFT_654609 [Chytriomyces cf. hyalinus JEL632]|nr:hypothetical protein BJ741DRAFT_654609 [Chytriomyces cf. hyalinus JEL632]